MLADVTQAPVAKWLFEIGSPIMWVVIFAVLVVDSRRRGRLNPWLVFQLAFTTMFWQDFYGGWGGYFLYNRHFALMDWWGTSRWTGPNKPWFLIAAYGWWWTFAIGLSAIAMERLRRARPRWNLAVAFCLTIGPFFYVYDLAVESLAVHWHWWDYTRPVGPSLHTAGGNFPLVWPLLPQVAWIFAVVCLVAWRAPNGETRFEAALRLDRFDGRRRHLARFGAYAVAFNVSYALILIIPMMLVRAAIGEPSTLVP